MKTKQASVVVNKLAPNQYTVVLTLPNGRVYQHCAEGMTLGELIEVLIDLDRGTTGNSPARYLIPTAKG